MLRRCVGTVVDLYGSWRFWVTSADSWQFFLFADSPMCLALLANTTINCKKRCQESSKLIRIWAWKGPQISKNETLGRFGGVLGALCFSNTFWEHHLEFFVHHFGATWSNLGAILVLTGFRRVIILGVSQCIWRNRKN